jgi:hypothetical protein
MRCRLTEIQIWSFIIPSPVNYCIR